MSQIERLERLRVTCDLTWQKVADRLGISVGMLMMVKAGQRSLSEKVLHKLLAQEVVAGIRQITGSEHELYQEDEIRYWIAQKLKSFQTTTDRIDFLTTVSRVSHDELASIVSEMVPKEKKR